MKIFTVAEMITAEKAADEAGISYAQMMETAGKSVAAAIAERYPVANKRIHVLVGTGNNGGDGLVAARYLAEAGAMVSLYLHRPRDSKTDVNYAKVAAMGLEMTEKTAVSHTLTLAADILIDALLGTGVTRPIGGRMADLLQKLGFWHKGRFSHVKKSSFLVAVDCPSGLNCDTGALDPLAMVADLTVTFGAAKHGHFRFPGAAACGELLVADIGIPPTLPAVTDAPLTLADGAMVREMLLPRPLFGHKGTFGTALIAAGSNRYWGAPLLAGRAAYRIGAGLVALAVPTDIRAAIAGGLPEATYPLVQDKTVFSAATADLLINHRADALLVGPGISEEAGAFMDELLAHADELPPLVVDADGLNLLATVPNWAQKLPPNSILTPHPGEMARLMGVPLADFLAQDRVTVARAMAQKWGHTVLLKGAYTVIAAADGRVTLLPFANPLLGVAGSGDVLAGAIVGLLAGMGSRGGGENEGQGGWGAAVLAGYLHGLAGDIMAEQLGNAGLLASELADALPAARKQLVRVA